MHGPKGEFLHFHNLNHICISEYRMHATSADLEGIVIELDILCWQPPETKAPIETSCRKEQEEDCTEKVEGISN